MSLEDREITTIEGLGRGEALDPVQSAFRDEFFEPAAVPARVLYACPNAPDSARGVVGCSTGGAGPPAERLSGVESALLAAAPR